MALASVVGASAASCFLATGASADGTQARTRPSSFSCSWAATQLLLFGRHCRRGLPHGQEEEVEDNVVARAIGISSW